MKLLTINKGGEYVLGVKVDEGVIDISEALSVLPSENPIPTTVMDLIREEKNGSKRWLEAYIDKFLLENGNKYMFTEDETELKVGTLCDRANENYLCWIKLSKACR